MESHNAKILRIVLDVVLYIILATVILLLYKGFIPPPHVRVSCNDPSIRMPFHQDTITAAMLLCITLLLPVIVIIVLECAVPPADNGNSPLRKGLRRSGRYISDLAIGFAFMYAINEVTKVASGEPRPSFWDVCSPNITSENCQPVSVSWTDCTNPLNQTKRKLIDSMRSFPSGHASVSVYSSICMIVYINQRLWNKVSRLIVPWLQLIWSTWTVICCVSRIWDNQHHWWDVLAGGLLGAFAAFMTLKYLAKWFIRGDVRQKRGLSIRRLLSTTSESDNHVDHHLDNRELNDITGQSLQEENVFSSVQL